MKTHSPFCIISVVLLIATAGPFNSVAAQTPLYMDPSYSFEERTQDLLSRMTLEEKLSQMMSRTPAPLDRLGIPAYQWGGEPGHAVYARTGVATIFPQAIAQAATWDEELILRVGDAISDEARARFHGKMYRTGLTFWSPVVELARDPRWGRTHECYGEDPFLTSRLSLALTRGLQGSHPRYFKTLVAPKHFVANNEEWRRHTGSSEIDETLLREYYLAPYQVLIQQGKAQSIMAAYNALNGVPCCCNPWLLTDLLRGEWGFEGSVVSDCNGIDDIYKNHRYASGIDEAIALAVNAGLDLECGDLFKNHLSRVVKNGLISEATIDKAVGRLLLGRFRLGLYDPPERVPYSKISMQVVDSPQHRQLARQTARKAMVLLKNNGGLLPLDQRKVRSIAVIGPNADTTQLGGYTGGYSYAVSPLEALRERLGEARLFYEKGCAIQPQLPVIPAALLSPPQGTGTERGLLGEYFNNLTFSGKPVLTRIDSSLDFDWGRTSPHAAVHSDTFSVRWTGRFTAPVSGRYYLSAHFDDVVRIYFDGRQVMNKSLNRNAATQIVILELESGRRYDLRIEYVEYWYKSAMRLCGGAADPRQFQAAVDAARKADVALVFLGTDLSVENEGVDRSDLNLPGIQDDLVQAVLQANPRTVAVLQNGSALSITRLHDTVPAILEAWFPGEEGGHAIADVLFGDYNPAGRLPLTFYRSVEQLPRFDDYDIRHGRTYMAEIRKSDSYSCEKEEPLYPFGYGLSYTRFRYAKLKTSPTRVSQDSTVAISVEIKNTGNRPGEEVAQLYIRDLPAPVSRPVKRLKGFQRLMLQPGESRRVTFTLPVAELAYWDRSKKAFVVAPGRFEIQIGSSSADIRLTGTLKVI